MAVPKQQKSKSKIRARRGKQVVVTPQKATCGKCGSIKIAHTACAVCGTYNGKQVLDVEKRALRKEKKLKAQEDED